MLPFLDIDLAFRCSAVFTPHMCLRSQWGVTAASASAFEMLVTAQADLIFQGKGFKEVVKGTEFDNVDPKVEAEMEEAKRRMEAFRKGTIYDYLEQQG